MNNIRKWLSKKALAYKIHPHFLFNTLNNIDELIETGVETSSAYLHKLSDILRFMLYETKTESIALADELAYIEKYIDLQKLRVSNTSYTDFSIHGSPSGVTIAPMIFIPFVENAFKFVDNKKTGNAIRIQVDISSESIIFVCENASNANIYAGSKQGGLGNSLIQKRLELLYPGRHILNVAHPSNTYSIKLVIFRDAY